MSLCTCDFLVFRNILHPLKMPRNSVKGHSTALPRLYQQDWDVSTSLLSEAPWVKGALTALGHCRLPYRTVLGDFRHWVLRMFADSRAVVKRFGCSLRLCSMTQALYQFFMSLPALPAALFPTLPSQSQHPISSPKAVTSSFFWCFAVAIAVPLHPDSLSYNINLLSFGFISNQNLFLSVNSVTTENFTKDTIASTNSVKIWHQP